MLCYVAAVIEGKIMEITLVGHNAFTGRLPDLEGVYKADSVQGFLDSPHVVYGTNRSMIVNRVSAFLSKALPRSKFVRAELWRSGEWSLVVCHSYTCPEGDLNIRTVIDIEILDVE